VGDKDRSNKLLVVIAGPTASGKTDTAIRLAQHYQTEIVNCDSRQVYRELNIGVGKPTPDQLKTVQHHLVGHASIFEHYSSGHYTTDALTVIHALFAKHDIVILGGGTGLYIKSVIEGFDDIPEIPPDVTSYWTKIWEEKGIEPLIDALAEMDPDYFAIVDRDNYSRLIRAVSVSAYTGKPFSSFRKGQKANRFFKVLLIALDLQRNELYHRIDQRVIEMLHRGWMEEALELYPHRNLKALQTVGYKELFEVIDGKLSLEAAIPRIQQSTRRYAKRQLTWFRNQGTWNWVHPENLQEMIRMIDESTYIPN